MGVFQLVGGVIEFLLLMTMNMGPKKTQFCCTYYS